MKKIIAVFVALAVCSSSVFALPVSAALNNPVQTKTETSKPEVSNDFTASAFAEDDLFASVNAAPLTNEEAQAVEGEGVAGAIGGAMLGAGGIGYIGSCIGAITGGTEGARTGQKIGGAIGVVVGGIIGGIFGP